MHCQPSAFTGHMAMLANPDFCDLAWHIGRASLGADEKQIWHLTKIYWYTVEVRRSLGHTISRRPACGLEASSMKPGPELSMTEEMLPPHDSSASFLYGDASRRDIQRLGTTLHATDPGAL